MTVSISANVLNTNQYTNPVSLSTYELSLRQACISPALFLSANILRSRTALKLTTTMWSSSSRR